MLEEASSSVSGGRAGPMMWASMVASWFTPTVLFVVINLVIGTIAVTSKSHHQHHRNSHNHDEEHQPRLLSRGSSVLARLRSINLHRYTEALTSAPTTAAAATVEVAQPATVVEEREEEEEEEEEEYGGFETLEEAYAAAAAARPREGSYRRSHSDSHPVEVVKEKTKLVKKAASTTAVFRGFKAVEEEKVEPRRPVAVKESRRNFAGEEKEVVGVGGGGGGEVDARADDFINRFKKQLQLQRLDSILRYKEMLNRGK